MAFQLLSKCYLDILMVPLFQHLWVIVPCFPCCFGLNKILIIIIIIIIIIIGKINNIAATT